jgi:hypothetical protein
MKLFSLLVAGSRIFLSLSIVAVFFVVLPLVICLQPHRHHRHFHEHVVVCTVLECVLSSRPLLSREPRILPSVLDL